MREHLNERKKNMIMTYISHLQTWNTGIRGKKKQERVIIQSKSLKNIKKTDKIIMRGCTGSHSPAAKSVSGASQQKNKNSKVKFFIQSFLCIQTDPRALEQSQQQTEEGLIYY